MAEGPTDVWWWMVINERNHPAEASRQSPWTEMAAEELHQLLR